MTINITEEHLVCLLSMVSHDLARIQKQPPRSPGQVEALRLANQVYDELIHAARDACILKPGTTGRCAEAPDSGAKADAPDNRTELSFSEALRDVLPGPVAIAISNLQARCRECNRLMGPLVIFEDQGEDLDYRVVVTPELMDHCPQSVIIHVFEEWIKATTKR